MIREVDEALFVKSVLWKKIKTKNLSINKEDYTKIDQIIKAIRAYCPEVEGVFGLFGKLATAIQSPNENVQQFADRLQDLMHKIIELKKEEEGMTMQLLKDFTETMRQQAAGYFQKSVKKEIRYELPHMPDFNQIVTRAKEIETLNVMRDNQGHETKPALLVANYESKNKQSSNFSCQICGDSKHEALFCHRAACVYCKETQAVKCNKIAYKNAFTQEKCQSLLRLYALAFMAAKNFLKNVYVNKKTLLVAFSWMKL